MPFGACAPMRRLWMASALCLNCGARRTTMGKCRSLPGSYRSPADSPPIAVRIVALMSPVASRAGAVDVDLDGRLAERRENRQIGDARHRRQHGLDLVGGVGKHLKVVAEQLDRVLALHARDRLGHVDRKSV